MTKIQSVLTSLVAVIPAVFLLYLLVMALLSHSENLTTLAYIVLGVTLICALAIVLIPAGILVGARRKPAPATVAVPAQSEVIETIDDDDEEGGRHESSGSFDAQDVLNEPSDANIGDSDQDMLGSLSESEIETEPIEDFDDDFDLEEEEGPKPKKKKKK